MKNILKNINGNEIIDYLNTLDDELIDTSVESNSFVFNSQSIVNGDYKLYFETSFNNWGTSQTIDDNYLIITEDSLDVFLNEPHDGDGSCEIVEDILFEWLETHKFRTDNKESFHKLIEDQTIILNSIKYDDNNTLLKVIANLTKANTLMK